MEVEVIAVEAATWSGGRVFFAWRTARNETGADAGGASNSIACDGSQVIEQLHSGVVASVELAPPIDGLAGGDGAEARTMQSQGPAAGGP
ncbi:MAG TPA: hypothetical protein VJP88_08580 [Caulobacteraceae bacterium]|nr:hypothetical protein [Caulobacteraceae bacterium]